MRKPWTLVVLIACTSSLLGACRAREEVTPSPREAAPPPAMSKAEAAPSPQEAPAPAPVVVAAAPAESTSPSAQASSPERPPSPLPPKPAGTVPKPPAAVPAPIPAKPTAPAAPPPATAAQAAAPAAGAPAPARPSGPEVADPGGEVVVSAGKPGLTRIGAEKCKLCHKAQYSSWATSAHARRTPPLDCEGCHGPGSEYKTLSVMKDPAKAKAAGLVQPDATFCGKCHKGTWDPALLGKVHAHKAAP